MARRLGLLTFLLTGLVMLAACGEPQKKEALATIELEGNPTTGYSWTYTMSPEGVVREYAQGYRKLPAAEGVVGTGGTALFVFEGIKPGTAELKFSYARPWEKGEPARTVVYVLTVDNHRSVKARKKQ